MKQQKKLGILIIIILFISIGFAYLSANLDIMGIANVRKMKWNIYFDNIKNYEHEECFNEKPTTTGTTTTSLNFKVSLEDPGDSCSFNVDVINDGTIDAMVSLLQKTDLDDAQSKLLDFNITYADGSPIENKNFLGSGESETLKVSLTFNRNIEIEDLPTADTEINVTIDLQYQQAKDSDKRQNSNTAIIKDLSGNANHGKIVGATVNDDGTVTTDGVDDYINCGLTRYNFGDSISLAIKLKFNNTSHDLIGNWETAGGGIFIDSKGISSNFKFDNTDDYIGNITEYVPQLDTWYTIVTTYDGTAIRLYINGEPIQNTTGTDNYPVTGNITPSPLPIYIGGNPSSKTFPTNPSNITIGGAAIFDRALDANEIKTNFSDSINPTNTEQLLAYYKFEK